MGEWLLSRRDSLIVARHEARSPGSEVPLEFGHLEAGFRFVPEGHAIVARRFIAGLALNKTCVPEGRLKLDLGCYESGLTDKFKVKIFHLPTLPNSGAPPGRRARRA
jgi:hypothetical protein